MWEQGSNTLCLVCCTCISLCGTTDERPEHDNAVHENTKHHIAHTCKALSTSPVGLLHVPRPNPDSNQAPAVQSKHGESSVSLDVVLFLPARGDTASLDATNVEHFSFHIAIFKYLQHVGSRGILTPSLRVTWESMVSAMGPSSCGNRVCNRRSVAVFVGACARCWGDMLRGTCMYVCSQLPVKPRFWPGPVHGGQQ